jgi:DNA replication protein DnaC
MQSEESVQNFFDQQTMQYSEDEARYYTSCFEACIPRTFWNVSSDDVHHNEGSFDEIVMKYCKRWKRARKHGYGLLFVGDNGSGKTMFLNFILTQMIKRGCTAYYTSVPQLAVDLQKGFKDNHSEKRLNEMLQSDFLAIDELGKERKREDTSYVRERLELLLKNRYDGGDPVLCASNLNLTALEDLYGSSVASIWEGKYQLVMLEHGDYRKSVTSKMQKAMGFEE